MGKRHGFDGYLIILRDTDVTQQSQGRAAIYADGLARSGAFVKKLRGLLDNKQWSLIEAGALGVSVSCTETAAEIIRRLPEVEEMTKDFGLGLIR